MRENRTYGWGEGALATPDKIDSTSARKDCTKKSAKLVLYSIVKRSLISEKCIRFLDEPETE